MRRRLALLLVALAVTGCESASVTSPTPSASAPVTTAPTSTPTVAATPSASPAPAPSRGPTVAPASPRPIRPAPAEAYSVRRVTAADLPRSWRAGCPVAPAQLRLVTVPYVDFAGTARRGELVVHQRVADDVGRTLVRLRDARFPIRSIRLVDDFGGSDDESMAADNTSAFNCRAVVGGSGGWSRHAYGTALDINPRENPYVYGNGTVAPPEGEAYVDRSPYRPGMVVAGGVVDRAFAAIGWSWGGRFRSSKDYQHFSESGR